MADLAASVGTVGARASCGTGGEREANAGKELRGTPVVIVAMAALHCQSESGPRGPPSLPGS